MEEVESEFRNVKLDFHTNFMNLFNLLVLLSKNNNAAFLYQLILRLDFNSYYQNLNDDPY